MHVGPYQMDLYVTGSPEGGERESLYIYLYIYIYKLIKIKEKQQIGIKSPKFSANAFLGGLFLTTERG